MTGRLLDRTVLITGAGQGIGRSIALACAAEGARVLATNRTLERMADLPELDHAISTLRLDVGDEEEIRSLTSKIPDVDVLVNCAGWVAEGSLLDSDDADWQKSWDINVMGPARLTRALLPGMLKRRRGSIVNVASVASSVTRVADRSAYGSTKAAMIGLTKSIARDYIETGVRCNALCPGTTESPSLMDRIEATENPDETMRSYIARQPMGRLGTVEEMAAAAVWMASDESAFMTGSVIVIDGGQTL